MTAPRPTKPPTRRAGRRVLRLLPPAAAPALPEAVVFKLLLGIPEIGAQRGDLLVVRRKDGALDVRLQRELGVKGDTLINGMFADALWPVDLRPGAAIDAIRAMEADR